jgi:hypothetical protein
MKKIIIFALISSFIYIVKSEESLINSDWKLKIDKGEIKEASFKGQKLIESLGDFSVAGKKEVRAFSEVAELREKKGNTLVYEGISDDGKCPYVEFGEIIELDKNFDFTLFTLWRPPSPWPADSEKGSLLFSKNVIDVKKIKTDPENLLPPRTLTYELKLKNGDELSLLIVGLNEEKTSISQKDGKFTIDFIGANDYVKDPRTGKSRSCSYWIASTDSHYVKFIFKEKR